jgi:hypothetical protein
LPLLPPLSFASLPLAVCSTLAALEVPTSRRGDALETSSRVEDIREDLPRGAWLSSWASHQGARTSSSGETARASLTASPCTVRARGLSPVAQGQIDATKDIRKCKFWPFPSKEGRVT